MTDTIKLNKILNDFLKEYECEVSPEEKFSYCDEYNLITYTLNKPTFSDKCFYDNFVNRLNLPTIDNDFVFSLLHELGHHETFDFFDDDDWDIYYNTVEMLEKKIAIIGINVLYNTIDEEDSFPLLKELNQCYYNLEIEKLATEWAVNFIKNNTELVIDLINKINEILY